MKRLLPYVAPVLLIPALAACGGSTTSATDASQPVVQPCDWVDVAPVQAVLGYGLTKNTGTAADPSCTLTPTIEGGAIFQFSYQWWFSGGLEAAWKTMKITTGHASTITVPGADGAKLVVQVAKKAAYVSGFLENGSLVQVVNGTALPKDVAKLKAATRVILAELSKGSTAASPAASPAA